MKTTPVYIREIGSTVKWINVPLTLLYASIIATLFIPFLVILLLIKELA